MMMIRNDVTAPVIVADHDSRSRRLHVLGWPHISHGLLAKNLDPIAKAYPVTAA